MKTFVVYSHFDTSRHFVSQVPDDVDVYDFYDEQQRSQFETDYPNFLIGRFPTVGFEIEEWLDHTNGDEILVNEASYHFLYDTENWQEVLDAQADFNARASRGWALVDDLPATGELIWTLPPIADEGFLVKHDGWEQIDGKFVRQWKLVEEGQDKDETEQEET